MDNKPLNVLAVVGSLGSHSVTRTTLAHLCDLLTIAGCRVESLDLSKDPLPLFNPETTAKEPYYAPLKVRVLAADVFLLGTPDYHGSMSGSMKNFLDHFWREFAGKLFATVVASHEKGLTATDQLRTVARQCYAWAMPYAVTLSEVTDVTGAGVVSEGFRPRLEMFARDIRVYGTLIAQQRHADLGGTEPGFLANHRPRK